MPEGETEKARRRRARRERNEADTLWHIATPSLSGQTLLKLKRKEAKPVNRAARSIVINGKAKD